MVLSERQFPKLMKAALTTTGRKRARRQMLDSASAAARGKALIGRISFGTTGGRLLWPESRRTRRDESGCCEDGRGSRSVSVGYSGVVAERAKEEKRVCVCRGPRRRSGRGRVGYGCQRARQREGDKLSCAECGTAQSNSSTGIAMNCVAVIDDDGDGSK
jgi:hypothetical protein